MREMRRKDRERDRDFALAVADQCEYAVMAVTLPGGGPYCIPLSIAREGEYIYYHCAHEGQKVDALKADGRVCITCVGHTQRMENEFTTEFESAVIFGTAEEVTEESEIIDALRLICQRHTPLNMDAFEEAVRASLARTAVWKIKIEDIKGKEKRVIR